MTGAEAETAGPLLEQSSRRVGVERSPRRDATAGARAGAATPRFRGRHLGSSWTMSATTSGGDAAIVVAEVRVVTARLPDQLVEQLAARAGSRVSVTRVGCTVGIDEHTAQRRVAVRRAPGDRATAGSRRRQGRHDPCPRGCLDRDDAAEGIDDLREPVPVGVTGVALRILERAHEDRSGASAASRRAPRSRGGLSAAGHCLADSRYHGPEPAVMVIAAGLRKEVATGHCPGVRIQDPQCRQGPQRVEHHLRRRRARRRCSGTRTSSGCRSSSLGRPRRARLDRRGQHVVPLLPRRPRPTPARRLHDPVRHPARRPYDDVDAQGVEIVQPPETMEWGMRAFMIHDAFGSQLQNDTTAVVKAAGGNVVGSVRAPAPRRATSPPSCCRRSRARRRSSAWPTPAATRSTRSRRPTSSASPRR